MNKLRAPQNLLYILLIQVLLLTSLSVLGKEDQKRKKPFKSFELTSRYASWGISPFNRKSSINLKEAWETLPTPKEKIVVAVIDTGIDPNHPFLKDNLYLLDRKVTNNSYGLDFSKNNKSKFKPFDSHGHGTHVAGIIKSVDPTVKLIALKYYNPDATGKDNLNSTIEALRYAVDQNVDIINYSGGGPEPALEELRILKEAEKKGILIVAAAGNEESDIDQKKSAYYPASYGLSNIITVSAYDKNLNVLGVSNYGKYSVDVFAPGHRIKSAYPNGRSGILTGTSQATAFVTGVASLIKSQYPSLKGQVIKKIISASAKEEVTFFNKCKSNGRLDAVKALKLAKSYNTVRTPMKRGIANKKKKALGKIRYRIQNPGLRYKKASNQ